jgi:hypothetical protein
MVGGECTRVYPVSKQRCLKTRFFKTKVFYLWKKHCLKHIPHKSWEIIRGFTFWGKNHDREKITCVRKSSPLNLAQNPKTSTCWKVSPPLFLGEKVYGCFQGMVYFCLLVKWKRVDNTCLLRLIDDSNMSVSHDTVMLAKVWIKRRFQFKLLHLLGMNAHLNSTCIKWLSASLFRFVSGSVSSTCRKVFPPLFWGGFGVAGGI